MIQMLDAGITVETLLDLIGVRLRFACLSCLIIPTQQFASAFLGHYHGVIVASDTTDRAVPFGITVHAHQVVPIGVIAEKVTEKSSMD